jgi:hypothetical protein
VRGVLRQGEVEWRVVRKGATDVQVLCVYMNYHQVVALSQYGARDALR